MDRNGVDWTTVIVALIASLPAILAAIFSYLNRRQLKVPSGDRLGAVMERTHDLSAADVALSQQVLTIVNEGSEGGNGEPRTVESAP